MESFQWTQCFETGLPTVDAQHQKLVDVINRFGNLLMESKDSSIDEIETVFGELASYAQYHFQEEEALMVEAELNPSYIEEHRNEHAKFIRDVTSWHDTLSADNRERDDKALLDFLTNWLAYHILGSDQLMACLMSAKTSGISQEEAYQAYQARKDPATATLLQAMNLLFNQVSERNRELLELNKTLEARVIERTHELSDANHLLENMAMTDVLTGLANRRHALLSFESEWQQSLISGDPLACMMIDADNFKIINDTFGHDAGDEVLRQLSLTLKTTVRNDDTVFRLGGDEFLILCANTTLDGAMQVAEKVRDAVSTLRVAAGSGVWVGSISVGVAVRNESMKNIEEHLKAADDSVYIAKHNGRNCVATGCDRNL